MSEQLVMIHPAQYQEYKAAVEKAFELFPPEVKGKRVLVQPNVLRRSTPDEGILNHPALLRAVVEKLKEMAPAAIVMGGTPLGGAP
jgi:uncharacterized protein (DUF362 family)